MQCVFAILLLLNSNFKIIC